MGVYFDGVDKGMDCPCCGNRWHLPDKIDVEKILKEGWPVGVYGYALQKVDEDRWHRKYDRYKILEEPVWVQEYGSLVYKGKIKFESLEDYAQFYANEFGWTEPDIRIFYVNGIVKEIFKEESNEEE